MSLDVYLYAAVKCEHCGKANKSEQVLYTANITHNLSMMAQAAGLYTVLWCPEEIDLTLAVDLIRSLEIGRDTLTIHASQFKAMNPKNGWGTYDDLLEFVENYLDACREHGSAYVVASV